MFRLNPYGRLQPKGSRIFWSHDTYAIKDILGHYLGKNGKQSQYPKVDLRVICPIVENLAEPWENMIIINVGNRKH